MCFCSKTFSFFWGGREQILKIPQTKFVLIVSNEMQMPITVGDEACGGFTLVVFCLFVFVCILRILQETRNAKSSARPFRSTFISLL